MAGGLKAVDAAETAPSADEAKDESSRSFHIRGKAYVLRELTGGEYYDEQRVAQNEDGDIDMMLLARLITLKGVTCDGKPLDPEAWSQESFSVVNRVQLEMRQMHFIAAETDEEKRDRLKAEAAARKGGGSPN